MAINKADYVNPESGDVMASDELITDLIDGINTNEATINEDTGWIEMTLLNGNVTQSSGACAYRKIGKVVYIRMHLLRANYNTIVTTLPVGFRPSGAVNIIGLDRGSNEVSRGFVVDNGNVSLGTFTQQNGFIVGQNVAYPIG